MEGEGVNYALDLPTPQKCSHVPRRSVTLRRCGPVCPTSRSQGAPESFASSGAAGMTRDREVQACESRARLRPFTRLCEDPFPQPSRRFFPNVLGPLKFPQCEVRMRVCPQGQRASEDRTGLGQGCSRREQEPEQRLAFSGDAAGPPVGWTHSLSLCSRGLGGQL